MSLDEAHDAPMDLDDDDLGLDTDPEDLAGPDAAPGDAPTPSECLILVSATGHEFFVPVSVARASHFINGLLNNPAQWREQKDGAVPRIQLPKIETETLEKVVQYWMYRQAYNTSKDPSIPPFPISLSEVVRLLDAAHYLDT